jgi:hypothetical protein
MQDFYPVSSVTVEWKLLIMSGWAEACYSPMKWWPHFAMQVGPLLCHTWMFLCK